MLSMGSDPRNISTVLKEVERANQDAQHHTEVERRAHAATRAELERHRGREEAIKDRISALEAEVAAKERSKDLRRADVEALYGMLGEWTTRREARDQEYKDAKARLSATRREAVSRVVAANDHLRAAQTFHTEANLQAVLAERRAAWEAIERDGAAALPKPPSELPAAPSPPREASDAQSDAEDRLHALEREAEAVRQQNSVLSEACAKLVADYTALQAASQGLDAELRETRCRQCGDPLLPMAEGDTSQAQ